MGDEDWANMFVTKLLLTNSGQCHSLPLLYLILAEQMQTEAWLAFSPSHTYVKIKDNNGTFHNIELTNGMFTTEAWIVGSGFVKSEAIRNRIYLDTLSKNQTMANMFVDLATGYTAKFGYDNFVLQCIDTSLKYYPNNINALKVKANYYTVLFNYVGKQLIAKGVTKEELKEYPEAINILQKRNSIYQKIDEMGYTEMPKDAYRDWLQSLEEERLKQEHQSKVLNLSKTFQTK